jgi:hypothetical protein
VKNPEGGYDAKRPDAKRASSHHDTQGAAERRAKEIVGNAGGGEVVIHRRITSLSREGIITLRATSAIAGVPVATGHLRRAWRPTMRLSRVSSDFSGYVWVQGDEFV